ncbi:MAG: NFYB/HAP3 family transcription factor subunit [Candidatus Helarchaeota archaeon]|nr:NFYB/HAP3 family transcription factor subunit [Candidatus Helarchaeota archaeon]
MAKKRYFAWSPLRKVMGDSGAKIVSRDAIAHLILWLEEKAIRITRRARVLAKHSRRKKITKGDITLAIKGYYK